MEDVVIRREERALISVLTMEYRPYNLLGPTLSEQSQRNSPPLGKPAAEPSYCAVGCAISQPAPTSRSSAHASNRAAAANRQSPAQIS